MRILRRVLLALMLVAVCLGVAHAGDDERVLSYHSNISVRETGEMLVQETIRVRATGDQIKHGIYRDFPTIYSDSHGQVKQVDFNVTEVLRDGAPDAYRLEDQSNGVRLYIGTKQVELNPGIYTYRITYQSNQQLGFFSDHDELYWNVTGNGWKFPIEAASATVTLPSGVPREKVQLEAYTGPKDSKGKDYAASLDADGRAEFHSTAPLKKAEGLTIVVSWPKGFVTEPPPEEATDERILSYQSEIQVQKDAVLVVQETIQVRATGSKIVHGIYRDFPTLYRTKWGLRSRVDFKVLEVLRDGAADAYELKELRNGVRVYIGKKDVELSPGIYTYRITYQTDRQMGFFSDHDELYWNVTGNGWDFPINQVSAVVTLPSGVPRPKLRLEAYTGSRGSKGKDYQASLDDADHAVFHTTAPLGVNEGLTIVVSWPKGFVTAISSQHRLVAMLRDNLSAVVGLFACLVVFLYYFSIWYSVGRDPRRGTIIPLFAPPEGLSPASVRFIRRMGFDNKTFAAALINMAVKRYLKIEEKKGIYTLIKEKGDSALSKLATEESKIASNLSLGAPGLRLTNAHHTEIQAAITAVQEALKQQCEPRYFSDNKRYFFGGFFLSLAMLLLTVSFEPVQALAPLIFMTIWLSGWSVGVFMLVRQTITAWTGVRYGPRRWFERATGTFGAIVMTLFTLPFVAGEIVGLSAFTLQTSTGVQPAVWILGTLNVVFYFLLRAPTPEGRDVLDKIDGFRMYLGTAEQDRLNLLNPPERTPELFEMFLPYALALDVEQQWSEKFTDVLAAAERDPTQASYHPLWYSGTLGAMSLASSIGGSLGATISSASTAPGSSSGSGGGGSSGGGGGGGGGGGW